MLSKVLLEKVGNRFIEAFLLCMLILCGLVMERLPPLPTLVKNLATKVGNPFLYTSHPVRKNKVFYFLTYPPRPRPVGNPRFDLCQRLFWTPKFWRSRPWTWTPKFQRSRPWTPKRGPPNLEVKINTGIYRYSLGAASPVVCDIR